MYIKQIEDVSFVEHDDNLASILVPSEMTGSYMVQLIQVSPRAKMPVHLHDIPQVYIILDGSAKLRVGDEIEEVSRGMVVFLPPHVEHETMEAGEEGLRYIVIE